MDGNPLSPGEVLKLLRETRAAEDFSHDDDIPLAYFREKLGKSKGTVPDVKHYNTMLKIIIQRRMKQDVLDYTVRTTERKTVFPTWTGHAR